MLLTPLIRDYFRAITPLFYADMLLITLYLMVIDAAICCRRCFDATLLLLTPSIRRYYTAQADYCLAASFFFFY